MKVTLGDLQEKKYTVFLSCTVTWWFWNPQSLRLYTILLSNLGVNHQHRLGFHSWLLTWLILAAMQTTQAWARFHITMIYGKPEKKRNIKQLHPEWKNMCFMLFGLHFGPLVLLCLVNLAVVHYISPSAADFTSSFLGPSASWIACCHSNTVLIQQ